MEKKIYSSYAFKENEREMMKINRQIYEELEERYKILKERVSILESNNYLLVQKNRTLEKNTQAPTSEELEQNDIVYSRKACYAHGEYRIYKCPNEVTLDELALICDGGNLCFGHRGDKKFLSVSED